jgi:hypothetical protein
MAAPATTTPATTTPGDNFIVELRNLLNEYRNPLNPLCNRIGRLNLGIAPGYIVRRKNPMLFPEDSIYEVKKNYPTLDNDIEVHKTVSKYFKFKLFEKYLKDDFYDLLAFFVVTPDDKIEMIKSMDEYNSKLEPSYKDELKIKEIQDNYISTRLIYKILKTFVKKNGVKWYHLQNKDVQPKVKKFMHKRLKQLLEEKVIKHS